MGGRFPRLGNWTDERAIAAFDRSATHLCRDTLALVCWSRSSVGQMERVKSNGGINLIERVGSDTLFQYNLLAEEYDLLGLRRLPKPSPFVLEREDAEYELADTVLCPSNHVTESLRSNPRASKCDLILNRYGVNANRFSPDEQPPSDCLEVLFVGTVGVRKGCIYFLKAAEQLRHSPQIKFTMVGPVEREFEPVLRPYLKYVDYLGPRPNSELVAIYRRCSVFVFPSLDEGMAYVQLEAQASGLPLISTRNAGGDHLIRDGVNGFLIPIRDVSAIVSAIERLRSDPELLASMRRETIKSDRAHTWHDHALGVIDTVDRVTRRKRGT